METKKKGIIIFLVFLSVLGISYIYLNKYSFVNSESDSNTLTQKEIDDSLKVQQELEKLVEESPTKEIDGKYILYKVKEKLADFEFNSGSFNVTYVDGTIEEGNSFNILDKYFVELQFKNSIKKYMIVRNDKNEVTNMTDGEYYFERVNE